MEQLKRLTLLALVLLAPVARAAERTYVNQYDLDQVSASAYIYCASGEYVQGSGRVITSGSSTTITTVNSTSGFGPLRAGDELFFIISGVETRRVISAVASTSSLTVTAAVDLSALGAGGYMWKYRRVSCGTTASDGWLTTAGAKQPFEVRWQVEQVSVTGGVDVRVECRGSTFTEAYNVYPDPANSASTNECLKGNFTAAKRCDLLVYGAWSQCRIGLKIATDDTPGGDTGADAENISALLVTQVVEP